MAAACDSQAEMGDQGAQQSFLMPAASPVLHGVVVPGPGAGVDGDGIKWSNEAHTAQMIFLQTELHPIVPQQVLQQPSLQSTSSGPHTEDVTCFISVAAASPAPQNQPQRTQDHTPLPGPQAAGHAGQGERPVKPKKQSQCVCPQCGRDCAKPSVLQKHVRSHTGERPFPCNTCKVSFKTQSNLYKHKRTQTHVNNSRGGVGAGGQGGSLTSSGGPSGTRALPVASGSIPNAGPLPGPQPARCATVCAPQSAQWGSVGEAAEKLLIGSESLESHQTGSRNLVLQRQQATCFPEQRFAEWSSSSSSLQTTGSTDSGYSDSTEQLTWASSPPQSLQEPSAEPTGALRRFVGNAEQSPARELPISGVDKRRLEERISKLISDNEAVVDDKHLDIVRPRKSILSKQGSIDLPMPYTYKDSFHFDMKSSRLNRKTDLESIRRAKQSVFSSLPSHSCATVGFSQVTRSNSLPPGAGQASPSTQLTPHRQPLQRGAPTAQCKDPSSPGLQPSLSRTLVRQAALDWLPSAQGECLAPAPAPGARKATHGKRGATEKRKLQKFSPERWSVYGEGTFRKIYQAKNRGSTPFTAQAANPAPASTPALTPTTSIGAASTPTSTPAPSITSTSTPAPSTASASTPATSKASASTAAPSKATASTTAPSIVSTPASSKAPTSNPGPTPMPSSTPAPLPTPHPRLVRQMSILVPEQSPSCCGVSVSRERVPVGVSEPQRGSGTGSGWPWARLKPTDSRGSVSSQTASDSPSPSANPSQAPGSPSPPQHPQNQLPGKGALLPRKASQGHNDFLPKYQLTRLSEEVSVSLGARSPSHSAQPIAEQQLSRESQEPALPAAWARCYIVCDTVTAVASSGHCPAVIQAESAHPRTGCSSPIVVTRRHTSASAQTPAALAHLVTQRFSAEPWASEKGIHARLVPQREGQTGRTDPEPSTEVHSAAACSDGAHGDHTATTMSPAASSAKPAVSYCLPEELTSTPAAHLLPFPTLQSEPKPTWCFLSKSIPLAGGQGLTSAYATWPTCSGNPAASHMAAKDILSLHCLKQSEQQPASSIEKSPMIPQSQCLQQEDATTFLRKNETEHRRSNRKRTATWNRGHRTDEVSVWASSRGKQRSQQCGIGCEKPSALRTNRHRHSHISARPYRCSLCTSAFKTKGNLTKHMKLKVHRKLRLRLRDASANQEQTRKPKVDINEAAADNQREQVAGRQSQVTPREAAQPLPLTNSTNPFPGSTIDAAFTADEPRITLVPLSSVHPTLNVQHGPSPAAQCTALPLDSIAGTWALLVPRSSVGSLCSQLPGGSFPLDALPISQGQKSSATMCFLKKQTSPVASLSVSATLVQTISEPSNSQVCVLAKTLTASHTKMSGISEMPGSVSQNSGINPAFTGSLLPVVPQVTQSAVAITTCTASDGSPFAVDTQRRQGEPKPNQDVPSLAVLLRGASKDMEPLLMTVIPTEVGEAGPPCLVLALTTAALSTLALPPLAPPTLAPPTSTGPTLTPSTLALPTLALPTLGQLSWAPLAPDVLTVLPARYSPSRCPDSSRYTQMLEVKPSESVRQPPCPVLHPVLSPQVVPTGHANLPGFPEPSQSQGAQGPAALRGSGSPSGVGPEDTASRSHPAHLSHPERTRASKHSPSPTTGQKAAVTATCEVSLPAPEEVPSLQYQDSLWSGSEVARLSQGQQVTQPIATPQARRERTVRQTRADYSDTSSDEDRLVIEA